MVCELPQQKRIMDKDKSKIGEFHFVTEPYLLDFRGRVTIPMIGNYLIHVASSHAAERGFGFNDMSERHTAWVLSRLAIEMIEYPAMSEPITLYMNKKCEKQKEYKQTCIFYKHFLFSWD